MKWLICLKLICLIFLAGSASADDFRRRGPMIRPHPSRPAYAYPGGGRLNVRLYNGYDDGITFYSPPSTPVKKNPCFPYSCEGIGEEQTNPHPRKESEIPACYYGVDDVLFFEKEGSTCPYIRPASPNAARVGKKRQEHLAREAAKKKSTEKLKQ